MNEFRSCLSDDFIIIRRNRRRNGPQVIFCLNQCINLRNVYFSFRRFQTRHFRVNLNDDFSQSRAFQRLSLVDQTGRHIKVSFFIHRCCCRQQNGCRTCIRPSQNPVMQIRRHILIIKIFLPFTVAWSHDQTGCIDMAVHCRICHKRIGTVSPFDHPYIFHPVCNGM